VIKQIFAIELTKRVYEIHFFNADTYLAEAIIHCLSSSSLVESLQS